MTVCLKGRIISVNRVRDVARQALSPTAVIMGAGSVLPRGMCVAHRVAAYGLCFDESENAR